MPPAPSQSFSVVAPRGPAWPRACHCFPKIGQPLRLSGIDNGSQFCECVGVFSCATCRATCLRTSLSGRGPSSPDSRLAWDPSAKGTREVQSAKRKITKARRHKRRFLKEPSAHTSEEDSSWPPVGDQRRVPSRSSTNHRYFSSEQAQQELRHAQEGALVAREIRALRIQAKLSQRQLGRLIGTTASVICRLEDDDYAGRSRIQPGLNILASNSGTTYSRLRVNSSQLAADAQLARSTTSWHFLACPLPQLKPNRQHDGIHASMQTGHLMATRRST